MLMQREREKGMEYGREKGEIYVNLIFIITLTC